MIKELPYCGAPPMQERHAAALQVGPCLTQSSSERARAPVSVHDYLAVLATVADTIARDLLMRLLRLF